MFDAIFNFFAVLFGLIMNFFYASLEIIGLPYLWLCIVLFSVITRLMFVPQKIGSMRKSILAPAINYDIRQLRKQYGSISKDDKEKLEAYKKDSKAIFKKHKVSSGSGCLITLLQFPIFVGLYQVVKEPFQYVSHLSHLSETERVVVNDFFGLSLDALPQVFGGIGIIIPAIVMVATLIRILPAIKNGKKQPLLIVLYVLQLALMTWMSFCVPIAISLYWVVNDITNLIIDQIVKSVLKKDKEIQRTLDETAALVQAEKEQEEAETSVPNDQEASSEEVCESFESTSSEDSELAESPQENEESCDVLSR